MCSTICKQKKRESFKQKENNICFSLFWERKKEEKRKMPVQKVRCYVCACERQLWWCHIHMDAHSDLVFWSFDFNVWICSRNTVLYGWNSSNLFYLYISCGVLLQSHYLIRNDRIDAHCAMWKRKKTNKKLQNENK